MVLALIIHTVITSNDPLLQIQHCAHCDTWKRKVLHQVTVVRSEVLTENNLFHLYKLIYTWWRFPLMQQHTHLSVNFCCRTPTTVTLHHSSHSDTSLSTITTCVTTVFKAADLSTVIHSIRKKVAHLNYTDCASLHYMSHKWTRNTVINAVLPFLQSKFNLTKWN